MISGYSFSTPAIMGIAFGILVSVTLLLGIGVGASVFDYHSSDAAGNGLARVYTVFGAILLWLLLGVILLWSGFRGGFPGVRGLLAVALYGVAIAAQTVALSILDRLPNHQFPEGWLRLVVAISPLLVLVHAVLVAIPGMRAVYAASPAQWVAPIALAIVSIIPWIVRQPYQAERTRDRAVVEQVAQSAQSKLDEVKSLPDDTPLAAILAYTEGPGMFTTDLPEAARARIRRLPSRQPQAEAMLAEGSDLLLIQLNTLELKVTPALCAAARKNLHRIAEAWTKENPDESPAADSRPYQRTERLIGPLRFLMNRDCPCQEEMKALASALERYPESFDKTFFLGKINGLLKGETE